MFNSIFKKQIVLFMGVLALSFLFTSVALTQSFRLYFTNQKEKALIDQGEKISYLFARAFRTGFFDIYVYNQIAGQLQVIYEYLDASSIIVEHTAESEFRIITVSEDIGREFVDTAIELPEFKLVTEGKWVSSQGRIGDLYTQPVLSVAYPIIRGIDNTVVGAVIMSSPLPELQKTIGDAYRLILMSLLLAVVISFILIYFSSKKMSEPLREMNLAAKVIADGNFEKRIETNSSDEVGQLAKSFNEMASGLNEQENLRKEFIANISHDFRSPLTSIRGFLTAIHDGTVPAEKIGHYIDIVLDETERLTKLANDILDINSAQYAGINLNTTDFDLNSLIRKTALNFETRVSAKKINMTAILEDNLTVNADYEKIRRSIYNLLDNALKFTPAGGSIIIETTLEGGKVLFSVKDTGKGIGEDEKKRVFERFYKSDLSRGEDRLGSGLGLSIVREFIKSHGEDIYITNRPEGGCEVAFTLTPARADNNPNEAYMEID